MTYGFNSAELMAFSLPVRVLHHGQLVLVSGQGGNGWSKATKVQYKNNTFIINKPLLGHRKHPRLPKTLFLAASKNYNKLDGLELFEQIRQANMLALIDILHKLNNQPNSVSSQLRQGCLDQLDALSQQMGQR